MKLIEFLNASTGLMEVSIQVPDDAELQKYTDYAYNLETAIPTAYLDAIVTDIGSKCCGGLATIVVRAVKDKSQVDYGWHDLMKNPEDLPKQEKELLIVKTTCDLWFVCTYQEGWFETLDGDVAFCADEAVAWKRMKPFVEVE